MSLIDTVKISTHTNDYRKNLTASKNKGNDRDHVEFKLRENIRVIIPEDISKEQQEVLGWILKHS